MQRSQSSDVLRAGLVLLVLLIGGMALLYAYRSQTPAVPTIPMTRAVTEIQDGRVDEMLLENDRATLTLIDALKVQTFTGGQADPLLSAVTQYNLAHPAKAVRVRYDYTWPNGVPGPNVVLSLLPLLLLATLIVLAARVFARGRARGSYEDLSRLADLRDSGVLTEDEFQREKRRLLG